MASTGKSTREVLLSIVDDIELIAKYDLNIYYKYLKLIINFKFTC